MSVIIKIIQGLKDGRTDTPSNGGKERSTTTQILVHRMQDGANKTTKWAEAGKRKVLIKINESWMDSRLLRYKVDMQ